MARPYMVGDVCRRTFRSAIASMTRRSMTRSSSSQRFEQLGWSHDLDASGGTAATATLRSFGSLSIVSIST
jgi:hypothetical protein